MINKHATNWEAVKFGDIVAHSAFGPRFSGDLYSGSGNVATLRTTDLSQDGKISYSTMPLANIDEEKFSKHFLKHGEIVISRSGRVGTTAIFDGFALPVLPGAFLIKFSFFSEKANPRFYVYFFNSPAGKELIQSISTGAAQQNINITNVKKLLVPYPPIKTQDAIVGILSNYDDLIENNTRRIEILEEMSRRLYEEWFVHFRFPGHEDVGFIESELGRVPEGWEVRRLENTVALNPRTKVPKDGEKWFVPMGALSESSMIVGTLERKPGNSGAKFQNGDTLVARITPCLENGKTGFVDFLPEGQSTACGSTEFIVLRSISLCPEMVYLIARSDRFRDVAIKSMSGATGRQRVRVESLVEFPVIQPDNVTLEAFQRFVSPCFKQIRTLARKNTNLRAQRDLLLPQLVSGEIDVSVIPMPDDTEVEAS